MKESVEIFGGIFPALDTRELDERKVSLMAHNAEIVSGKIVPHWIDASTWTCGTTNGQTVSSPINEERVEKDYFWNALPGATVPPNAPSATVTERYVLVPGTTAHSITGANASYIYGSSNAFAITNESDDADDNTLDVKGYSIFPTQFQEIDVGTASMSAGCLKYYFAKRAGVLHVNYKMANFYAGTSSAGSTELTGGTFGIRSGHTSIAYDEGCSIGSADIPMGDGTGTPYARVSLTGVRLTDRTNNIDVGTATAWVLYEGCKHHYDLRVRYSYPKETRYYMYTYAYAASTNGTERWESPNSGISGMIQCRRGDIVKVDITGIPENAGTNKPVKAVYVYRTAGTNKGNSASFYLCKELTKVSSVTDPQTQFAGTSASFIDDVLDSQLGEKHMDVQNPPSGPMKGTLYKVNGSLVIAARGSTVSSGTNTKGVWLSEPYMPYNWPIEYNYTVEDPIVKLQVIGSTVVIMTKKNTYTLVGSSPAAMTLKKSVYENACLGASSVVSSDGVTYYASEDGLIAVDANGKETNLSEQAFTREQWNYMNPSTMISRVDGDRMVINITDQGENSYSLVYDMARKEFTTQDATKPTTTELKWRSKIFNFESPVAPSVARVVASYQKSTLPIKFRLIAISRDSTQSEVVAHEHDINSLPAHAKQVYPVLTGTETESWANVTTERAFRLPHMRRELEYMIEIKSQVKIIRVDLATSMGELNYVNDRQQA